MSTFKVGDKVVSIREDASYLYIKKGSTYTVSKVRPSGYIELKEIAKPHDYSQQDFKLAPHVNKFKVGDKVRCVNSGGYPITLGKVYTVQVVVNEFLHVIDDEGTVGGYRHIRFELVQEPVLTPEEVFKHLRKGTKLEWSDKGTDDWYTVHSNRDVLVGHIETLQWRIKPVPEIIEANGRKYKLIEE